MMQDAEVIRSRTRLLLDFRNKIRFLLKNNFEFMRILESTRRKGFEIYQRNNIQKIEFLLISIIFKNVYKLRGLFKDFVKLDRQENIF